MSSPKDWYSWYLSHPESKVSIAQGETVYMERIEIPGKPTLYHTISDINGKILDEYWTLEKLK